jgi:hypothetical protein
MALFDAQGLGVYLNDDGAVDVGDPTLPAGHQLGPSSTGIYYLAIFSDETLPFSGAGASIDDLIFPVPEPPYTEVLGPAGGGGAAPLSGWATQSAFSLNAGYQIFLSGAEPAESTPSGDLVNLSGNVQTTSGTGLCAMVLASGQFMFSCNPNGPFSLSDLPRGNDGNVKRQVYVDGFFPNIAVLPGSVDETVQMARAGTCPDYNSFAEPGVFPGSAHKWIDISGRILSQNTQTPICAMVLANGQFMFSCDGAGSYALNIPLDSNGQFKLQVYADGFAPTILRLDEFSANSDVRMAGASECQ